MRHGFHSLHLAYTSLNRFPNFIFRSAASTTAAVPFRNSGTKSINFCHTFQECTRERSLGPGKQAHAMMIATGFVPTVFVYNCLIQMYVKCSCSVYAQKVFDEMPERDSVSWNSLVSGYFEIGDLGTARELFGFMPVKDAVSWNVMVSGYLREGDHEEVMDVFLGMQRMGVVFDQTTLALVLKSCSFLNEVYIGLVIHGVAVKTGFVNDMVTGCALVDMYGKSRNVEDSYRFFDEMRERNWICWSAIIAAFVQNDWLFDALELFKDMQRQEVGVSQSTYASLFRSCAGLSAWRLGAQLHGHAIKSDFATDAIVGTASLDMYAKCGNLMDAQKLFDLLPIQNRQCYNAMMVGYTQNERGFEAMELFRLLRRSYPGFDETSLSVAFSASAVMKQVSTGCQLHGLSLKLFRSNICVENAILDMYGKCGDIQAAQRVFDEMLRKDAVSWNAIIAAYEQNGDEDATLWLYINMIRSCIEPDEFTYGSVLKTYSGDQDSNQGMVVHCRAIKTGIAMKSFVATSLVDMYCKCGMMDEALVLHDRLEEDNLVSWNSIISGYSALEQEEEAQKFFSLMLEMGITPDNFTYATVLDTCANVATIGLGRQIHCQIIKQELQSDAYIVSTLVDMYSKCGSMQESSLLFGKALKRDFVTWNAMICGYAYHGFGLEALEVFSNMIKENMKPNHATFLAVLRACGHIGLVEEGLSYFYSMNRYGLDPLLEHYSCMVDILGRRGHLLKALELIEEMPFEADDTIWRTLLSVCKFYGNVEVAEKAANAIMQLDPEDSSVYILLNNVYADAGMWDKVQSMRNTMRSSNIKKEPGCSWIEVLSEVHSFLANEKAHPKCDEMYKYLRLVYDEIVFIEHVYDTEFAGEF
ncbi:hypothetical protein Droror1_Dr00025933 [Drosera rotundifolia]